MFASDQNPRCWLNETSRCTRYFRFPNAPSSISKILQADKTKYTSRGVYINMFFEKNFKLQFPIIPDKSSFCNFFRLPNHFPNFIYVNPSISRVCNDFNFEKSLSSMYPLGI